MDLSDSVAIPRNRQTVWQALNDPEILQQSIPGCQELVADEDGKMAGSVTIKIGPIKATFKGEVTPEDVVAPESYVLRGEGKGGMAGFAKGDVAVRLEEQDATTTILHYAVKVNMGGRIAQLGARLIDSTAKKLTDQFFNSFNEIVANAPA